MWEPWKESFASYGDRKLREKRRKIAKNIAIESARKYRPSYYAEPFEPHEWVIAAIERALSMDD